MKLDFGTIFVSIGADDATNCLNVSVITDGNTYFMRKSLVFWVLNDLEKVKKMFNIFVTSPYG